MVLRHLRACAYLGILLGFCLHIAAAGEVPTDVTPEDCRAALLSAPTEVKVGPYPGSDNVLVLVGRIDDAPPELLATVSFNLHKGDTTKDGGDTLSIGVIRLTQLKHQGRGIQTLLYQQLLKYLNQQRPVARMTVSSLIETNELVLTASLLELLRKRFPDYPKLPTQKQIQRKFDRLPDVAEDDHGDPISIEERKATALRKVFWSCCSELFSTRLTEQERIQIMKEAAMSTPAVRTRKKLGFSQICAEPSFRYTVASDKVDVDFVLCRK